MRRKDAYDRDSLHFAPFLLLPSPFPRQEFQRAVEMQVILNELMHNVAHDRQFLTDTLAHTIAVDTFTARLHQIFVKVWDEGLAQVRRDENVLCSIQHVNRRKHARYADTVEACYTQTPGTMHNVRIFGVKVHPMSMLATSTAVVSYGKPTHAMRTIQSSSYRMPDN